jgi:hypothetical protein
MCDIRTVTYGRRPDDPLVLTTACGWSTGIPQGTPWNHTPAYPAWRSHVCAQPAEAVSTG